MSKKTKTIIAIIGFALFIALAVGAYALLTNNTSPDTSTGETKKVTAADFTVQNIDNEAVTLSSQVGKPIILNFWASWCPPCKKEMPDLQKQFDIHKEEITFMMINLTDGQQETITSATNYIAENNYTFPIYFDTTGKAANTYNILSIPTTFFIDKNGDVVKTVNGLLTEKALAEGIDLIL